MRLTHTDCDWTNIRIMVPMNEDHSPDWDGPFWVCSCECEPLDPNDFTTGNRVIRKIVSLPLDTWEEANDLKKSMIVAGNVKFWDSDTQTYKAERLQKVG